MENKGYQHILWHIIACKEQINYIYKEISKAFNNTSLSNSFAYKKMIYYFSMSKTLILQLEQNYIVVLNKGNVSSTEITRLKNTYLQRSLFNFSMCIDYFKEFILTLDNSVVIVNKMVLLKMNNIKGLLEKITLQLDNMIKFLEK